MGDVVVSAGRITAIGEDVAPAGAKVVDVAGGLLLPGFTDAHVHPVQGGLERLACDLSGLAPDRGAYLRHIGDYARAHPDLDWIQGGGWAMAAFPGGLPTARELDGAVPDRPVALANRDHHGMWVNTRALETAGITATTPDPADGHVERDASGAPTGVLHEGAMALLGHVLPTVDDDTMYAGLLEGQRHLHSLGITELAGRDRRALRRHARRRPDVRPCCRRAATSPAPWWARCGGSATGAPSRSPSSSRSGPPGRPAGSRRAR